MQAACRPQPDHPVKRILSFEVPSSTEWQSPTDGSPFVLNWFEDISDSLQQKKMALEVYESEMRQWPHSRSIKTVEKLGYKLVNVIHPKAQISGSVKIGKGNYIKSAALLETNTTIGHCCIIDNGSVITHDNQIGNGCHIAPGESLGSSICIGDFCVIGIGVSISTNVKIGKNCIISVGSSVTKDVPDNSIVEGVPGKVIGTVKK